jgi:hypothetical protein
MSLGINCSLPLGFTFEDLKLLRIVSSIYQIRMLNDKKKKNSCYYSLNRDNTLEMTMNTPYMGESDIEEMTWYKFHY